METEKRQIKKFILFVVKLALFLVVAFYAYQGLFWFLWQYDKGPVAYDKAYQHALYRQYQQISDPNREPEIIFFGSSTCAFGIDVNAVKEVTGTNAQIFGMESAISPRFLTDELRLIAKPGDTIVCVFDGGDDGYADFITVCCAFEENKEFLDRFISNNGYFFELHKNSLIWRKLYSLSAGPLVDSVRSKFSKKDQVYNLASFDENGNMTIPRPECFLNDNVNPDVLLDFNDIAPELIDRYNDFNAWCIDNDIRFVIAYNMHPEGSLYNSDDEILEYHNKLSEALDAEIITYPTDGLLPPDNFYNSYYHLNSVGAREYSLRIARAL